MPRAAALWCAAAVAAAAWQLTSAASSTAKLCTEPPCDPGVHLWKTSIASSVRGAAAYDDDGYVIVGSGERSQRGTLYSFK